VAIRHAHVYRIALVDRVVHRVGVRVLRIKVRLCTIATSGLGAKGAGSFTSASKYGCTIPRTELPPLRPAAPDVLTPPAGGASAAAASASCSRSAAFSSYTRAVLTLRYYR
jgi:hypothetical protein